VQGQPTFAVRDLPIVTPDYRQLLRDTLTMGTYSEMIHLFALSKALGVPLQSYCPPSGCSLHPYTIYVHKSAFERTFRPGTLTLMWTATSMTALEPNHIVPLVPCQPSTGLVPRNEHPVEDCIADNADEPMDETGVQEVASSLTDVDLEVDDPGNDAADSDVNRDDITVIYISSKHQYNVE